MGKITRSKKFTCPLCGTVEPIGWRGEIYLSSGAESPDGAFMSSMYVCSDCLFKAKEILRQYNSNKGSE